MEYDVTASATGDGHLVYSTYLSAGVGASTSIGQGLLGKTVLWDRKGSESGILSITAVRTGGSNASVLATLNWEELR